MAETEATYIERMKQVEPVEYTVFVDEKTMENLFSIIPPEHRFTHGKTMASGLLNLVTYLPGNHKVILAHKVED